LRNDGELHRKTRERLAIDLGVDRIGIERLADKRIGFPEVDVLFLAKISHPEGRQVAQITQAALRSECHALELVFEKVSLIGDLEWAAVMLGTANDDKCRLHLAIAGAHAEAGEGVANYLARALPPVSEDADTGLEAEVYRIDDHAVRTRSRNREKVAPAVGILERSGEPKSDVVKIGVDQAASGTGNVPRKIEFFRQDVGGAAGKQGKGNTIAIRSGSEAVDDFVERAIAAASNHELTMFADGLLGDLNGVARAGGLCEFGFDAVGRENASGLVEKSAASIAAIASVRVMNEERVLKG